jgi:hypothetical protein
VLSSEDITVYAKGPAELELLLVPAQVDEILLERQVLRGCSLPVRLHAVEDCCVVLHDVVDGQHAEPEALVLEGRRNVEVVGD